MSGSQVFVLCIIFMVVVIPVLLSFISSQKKGNNKHTSQLDEQKIEELFETAQKLSERVNNLEAILDEETPNWRSKYGS